MCRCHRIVTVSVVAGLLLAVAGQTGLAQPSSQPTSSLYGNLDLQDMAKALRDRGMHELQTAFVGTISLDKKSVTARAMAAEDMISQAARQGIPEDKRQELLTKAGNLYREIVTLHEKTVEQTPEKDRGIKKLQHFKYRYRLAEVIGIIPCESHALKLLYLQGGQEDRDIIKDRCKEAAELLDDLNSQIETAIQDWRTNMKDLVGLVPEGEQVQMMVRYKSSWVFFYSAMAMPKTKKSLEERTYRLEQAITGVQKWAAGGVDSGVKFWSLLLWGMSCRELAQHTEAGRHLAAVVAGKNVAGEIRVRAYIEIARNHIEGGKFAEARKAILDFRTRVRKLYGKKGEFSVDLMVAMLRDYMFRAMAAKQAPGADLHDQADLALLHVAANHSEWPLQMHWAKIVERKYGKERPDSAPVLYAGAMTRLDQWKQNKDGATRELKDKVIQMLEQLVGQTGTDKGKPDDGAKKKPPKPTPGPTPPKKKSPRKGNRPAKAAPKAGAAKATGRGSAFVFVKPMALWRLAFAWNWDRDNDKAGGLFLQIAREYGRGPRDKEHPLARKAAEFAVRSYLGVIKLRRDKSPNAPIDPKLRKKLIEALEVLLKRWSKDPDPATGKDKWNTEIAKWFEDLGMQLDALVPHTPAGPKRLAVMDKAVKAYGDYLAGGAPTPKRTMQVRHLMLSLEFAQWQAEEKYVTRQDDKEKADKWKVRRAEWARELVKDLNQYGEDCLLAAKRVKTAGDKPHAKDLREWGAESEYQAGILLYEVLDNRAASEIKMADLPKRWPGTSVLIDATEFVIRKLILAGKTTEATKKLDEFLKTYKDPERYQLLVEAIIQQISTRIKQLRSILKRNRVNIEAAKQLAEYRAVYHNFAKVLFDRDKTQPLAERFAITKLYANALLEAGDAARDEKKPDQAKKLYQECLGLLTECKALGDQKREKITEALDKALDDNLKALQLIRSIKKAVDAKAKAKKLLDKHLAQKAAEAKAKAKQLLDKYVAELKEKLGIVPGESNRLSGPAAALGGFKYTFTDAKKNDKVVINRLGVFTEKMEFALKQLTELLKRMLPYDADVLLGLARAYRNLGDFESAMKYYHMMSGGIKRSEHPDLFWETELEYVTCAIENFVAKIGNLPAAGAERDKAGAQIAVGLNALIRRIKGLKLKDKDMGLLVDEFAEVQTRAEEALKQLQGPK